MYEKTIKVSWLLHFILIDAIIIAIALFIPIIAHSIGGKVLIFEPMRMVLFLSVLFLKERTNNCLMAAILPWISLLFVGTPVAWKASLMSIELLANIWLLYWLLDKSFNSGLAVCISTISAKSFYYMMKYLLIKLTLLPDIGVIGSLPQQLLSIALFSVLFLLLDFITKRVSIKRR